MSPDHSLVATRESDPDLKVNPDFAISLWPLRGERDEVEVAVSIPTSPATDKVASAALLHGLGIMVLDQQGIIGRTLEKMFPDGLPSEAQACTMIHLLLENEANDQLV